MRLLFHQLAALITQKPRRMLRVGVDFNWSKKLWTHNLFRAFEMMFGAYEGIYPSVASWHSEDGERMVAYTFEAQCALFEVWVRSFSKKFAFQIVVMPQLQLAGMRQGGIFPYRFAIAFDATAATTGTGSVTTLTHTCTGTNLFLFVFLLDNLGANPNPTMTYNSVSMTNIDAVQYPSDRWTHDFTLANPSTGANTVASGGTNYSQMGAISYTGVNQSSTPDSHNTASTTGNPWTISTTVVASNCWLAMGTYGMDPGPFSVVSGTARGSNASAGWETGDSNGTVGTGSQSIQWNGNTTPGRTAVGLIISIAPVAAGGGSTPQFVIPPPLIIT